MHRGWFVLTPTPPLAGRSTTRPGPVRVCVCSFVLAGSGVFWCASPFPLAALSVRFGRPHPGSGCLFLGRVFFSCCFARAPAVSCVLWFSAPGAVGLGALFSFPHPLTGLCCCFFFFSSFLLRPRYLWLSDKQSNRQITEENSSSTILKHVKSVESVLCDKHKFLSYVSN